MDIVYFGLSKLDSQSDLSSTLDFAKLLEEEAKSSTPSDSETALADDIYYYEGHDYKAEKAVLDKLIESEKLHTDDGLGLSRDERLKRAEINRLKKLEAKKAKWKELGYVSKAFEGTLTEEEESAMGDETHLEYVTGDVTDPHSIPGQKAIIIQYGFA